MESTDLDMGEIFDEDDDDIGAVSALPDLPEYGDEDQDGEGERDNEEAENTEVLARLKDLSKGAAKKVVRRPQPKLDATRLTGERGIPIVPKMFEKVKFKGKGHEAQDLALLMRNLEHWAHRLFPKMPFDEVLERVERLGAKREVQTCVKKMRLDMPVLNEDFVGSDKEDDVVRQEGDLLPDDRTERDVEEEWEDLLREEAEAQASQTPSLSAHPASNNTPGPSQNTLRQSYDTPGPSHNTPGLNYDTPDSSRPSQMSQPSTPAPPSQRLDSTFTPEQLERIERNKQLAREKRLAKMGIRSPATPLQTRAVPGNSLSSQAYQSSQELPSDESDRVTSLGKQTASQINTQRNKNSDMIERISENTNSGFVNSLNKQLDSDDEEMSEVIQDLKDTVVVKNHEDGQKWCTEQSGQSPRTFGDTQSSEDISLIMASKETTVSESETAEKTDKFSKHKNVDTTKQLEDSEEMSVVIPIQNVEKVNLDIAGSKAQTEDPGVFEDMSESIEKEDFERHSVESNKENLSALVNEIKESDKNKVKDLNYRDEYLDNNRSKELLNTMNGDIDMTGDKKAVVNETDELGEDELMETLEN